MRFGRGDQLLIDPIEAGILEADLSEELGEAIEVRDRGHYFDVDLAAYAVPGDKIISSIRKRGYIPLDDPAISAPQ